MFVNYCEDIIKKFTYLYTSVSDAFTIIDDYMIFYIDLYSHCDAAFRDLFREPEQANSSQRVSKGMPRLRRAIKGMVGGAASHQLSVTSLASNYNILAAGDKSNNNTHKDPGSAPHTELGSDQRQPDNGQRKSKDQDDDSETEDNSAPTEKEELSVTDMKKVRQNKQTTAPQKSKATALRRQTRVCASRTVSLKEAAPTSTSTRRKRSSQEKAEPPKKRSRKPATVQISDGGQAAGIEDIEEGVNILPKTYERKSVLS